MHIVAASISEFGEIETVDKLCSEDGANNLKGGTSFLCSRGSIVYLFLGTKASGVIALYKKTIFPHIALIK